MATLEEGIGDFVRPKNKFESQGKVYKTVLRPAMMYGAEMCVYVRVCAWLCVPVRF